MLIDISPPISPETPVWPGDTPLRRELVLSHDQGSPITLSSLHSTTHIGAHCDAPLHVLPLGRDISELPLEPFIGECQLIDLLNCGSRGILPSDICVELTAPRILLKLAQEKIGDIFPQVFGYLTPELVELFKSKKVITVGISSPSVDPFDSKELLAHHELFKNGISILEGLALDAIQGGIYELIALPLRLVGFDASPVRAVLRTKTI